MSHPSRVGSLCMSLVSRTADFYVNFVKMIFDVSACRFQQPQRAGRCGRLAVSSLFEAECSFVHHHNRWVLNRGQHAAVHLFGSTPWSSTTFCDAVSYNGAFMHGERTSCISGSRTEERNNGGAFGRRRGGPCTSYPGDVNNLEESGGPQSWTNNGGALRRIVTSSRHSLPDRHTPNAAFDGLDHLIEQGSATSPTS